MFRILLALFTAATLSCQPEGNTSGDEKAWNEHLKNAQRANEAKEPERAELELRAALRLLENAPEARQTRTRVMASLAQLKGSKGEIDAAGSLYEAVISLQLKDLEAGKGLVSNDLVSDMGQLAMVRILQQEHALAESLVTSLLTMREEGTLSLEPFDPGYYRMYGIIARSFRERGLTAPADSLEAVAVTYEHYARGFEARVQEHFPEAQKHLLNALSSGESLLGATHPDIARFCRDLSVVYTIQGQHDDAAAVLHRAVAIVEKSDDSLALALTLEDLAASLDHLNRAAEAQAMRDRAGAVRALR